MLCAVVMNDKAKGVFHSKKTGKMVKLKAWALENLVLMPRFSTSLCSIIYPGQNFWELGLIFLLAFLKQAIFISNNVDIHLKLQFLNCSKYSVVVF